MRSALPRGARRRVTARRSALAATAAAALIAGAAVLAPGASAAGASGSVAVAPYEYLGWGSPQDPAAVMSATGIKWFTLAFVLADNGCNPAWDGSRPLTGGTDQAKINEIRSHGGDVVASFGGWSGSKLGEACSSSSKLAAAYQKVISAYKLKAIDIDIENTEVSSSAARGRVVAALRAVQQNNPGIKTYLTFGTTTSGPDGDGLALIKQAKAAGFTPTAFTIMPFDFGSHSGTMAQATASAANGLHSDIQSVYGLSSNAAYAVMGISSMNGKTDESDETVSTTDFKNILAYANAHHLSRLTFWAINRDRACSSGASAGDSCSGVSQGAYAYTKIFAPYAP